MLLNFTSANLTRADTNSEASASPAAAYFGEKKVGGEVKEGAESFARSLEAAKRSKDGAKTDGKAAKLQKDDSPPEDPPKAVRELIADLDDRELMRVLMQFSPQDLFRVAEALGFENTDLPARFASAVDFDPIAGIKSARQNRGKLAKLLDTLVKLFGEQRVIDAIAAVTGNRQSSVRDAGKVASVKPLQAREIGQSRSAAKKPRIVVMDLRREGEEAQDQVKAAKSSLNSGLEKATEGETRDVPVVFRSSATQKAAVQSSHSTMPVPRAAQSFEQRFVPEVVKQTGIILKSGGAGEIRLVLKPENLGSVRIRLSMTESSLEGRIVVDNNSVKELVESSLDNLKNALRLEGYETNLEVSVGHRRNWDGNGHAEAPVTGGLKTGSEEFEKGIPLFWEMKPDYELINVFA